MLDVIRQKEVAPNGVGVCEEHGADEAETDAKPESERRMLLCTCGEGDHYVEDE